MSAVELLGLITQAFFILLSLLTGAAFLRRRTPIRRDTFLMFAAQAVPFYIQVTGPLYVTTASVDTLIAIWYLGMVAFTAQPYLLLRLLGYLCPVPKLVMRAAFVAMLISWGGLYLAISAPQTVNMLVIVVYFAAVDLYATVRLARGALTNSGVARHRLRFAALGSGLMGVILILTGLQSAIPTFVPDITLNLVLAIASAVGFYIGFAPPRWLRQNWQLQEFRAFLLGSTVTTPSQDAGSTRTYNELVQAAIRAMNGAAAVIVQKGANPNWLICSTTDAAHTDTIVADGASLFDQVWQERQPRALRRDKTLDRDTSQLMDRLNAEFILLTPIATTANSWGLLVAFVKHGTLFIEDDLNILTLLAQHGAVVLENIKLVEELRTYSQQLEQTVESRTAEIRRLNAELEQRVADRTAQLSLVNKELEAFSYSVSHDLRAPLRALDGFSQALAEDYAGQLDSGALSFLDRIRAASQRMGQLIDDLLQLSRFSQTSLHRNQVDLSRIAREITAELSQQQANRQVEVRIENDLTTEGDESLLRVALQNLINNAWKYTRKQPQPYVEFGATERDGKPVYFIRDNGAGFDMSYADKLFSAFQRLHDSSEFEGTGIGLATVQRIVQRHGGEIWVDAAVNKGATFYFTL